MKKVIIESPFAGKTALQVASNVAYLHDCIKDSLARGEAPFASHGFYTLYLDDTKPEQRKQGMEAGFAWGEVADTIAIYYDHGLSSGMKKGIIQAIKNKVNIVFRSIYKEN